MTVNSFKPGQRRFRLFLTRLAPALIVLLGALTVPAAEVAAAGDDNADQSAATAADLFDLSGDPILMSFAGVFIAASIIAVWFAIERLVVLRRGRVIPRPFVARILEHIELGGMDKTEALKVCEENDSPLAHIFAHGIRKWGKPSVEVEQGDH